MRTSERMAMVRRTVTHGRALASRVWAHLRSSPRAVAAFIVYAALIAAVTPPVVSWPVRIAFYAFAVSAFTVVWDRSHGVSESVRLLTSTERRYFRGLLVLAGVTLVVSRILPFLRYGQTPLGYDTGFYLSSIDGSLRGILNGGGLRTLRALIWLPFDWLGIAPIMYFHGLYVLAQFLIAGTLYAYVRTIRIAPRIAYAATAVFLFAVSIPQFFAYWWMYYQTEFAIAFLLATLTFLYRRSFLALIVGAFGAVIHPATFLPFAIAIATLLVLQLLHSLIRLRPLNPHARFLLLASVIAVLVAWPFMEYVVKFSRIYLDDVFTEYGWLLANYPPHLQPLFSGLYVTLPVIHLANIYLLPFVCLSVTLLVFQWAPRDSSVRWQVFFPMLYGAVLLGLNIMGVIYANRYLIYLDLALIAIAAPLLVRFVRQLLPDRVGSVVVGLLCVGLLFHGGRIVWKQEPHITRAELAEIVDLASRGEPNAYIMTTISHYTPWLLAFARRPFLDPGYGAANRWSYEQWQEFWSGKSDARRHELLRYYSRPMYVFVGSNAFEENLPYLRFIQSDERFTRVSPHVWRYDPQTITADDIEAMRLLERSSQEMRSTRSGDA